jgi:2'-5' RNA ligase
MPRRTALIVAVPEAEHAVGAYRLEHDWSAPLGVPAHITVLFPFVAPTEVEEAAIAEVVATVPAFDFSLDRIERFDEGPVWLHPEPSEPFRALTRAVSERWRDHPPYEGAHDDVIPHLTVSYDEIEVSIELPIPARADSVVLIEEDANGYWRQRTRFPLGV